MTDPFVAEIRLMGFTFAPTGWAQCNGGILPLSQNTALFSLLGTTYGGDGKSNFALPNLQGAAAVGANDDWGSGQPLAPLGAEFGSDTVSLLQSEMPAHDHTAQTAPVPAELQAPAADRALARSTAGAAYQSDTTGNRVTLSPQSLAPAGSDFPHNNRPPSLAVSFCIALQGVFPPRW